MQYGLRNAEYDSGTEEIYWSFANISVGSENSLIINYIAGQTFAGTLTSGPASVLNVPIKITATA